VASPPVPALDARDSRPHAALRAWLALQEAFPLRPQQARLALERAGGDPERAAGFVPRRALDGRIEALARCAALAVPFGSPLYPPALAPLPDAPPLLFVQGEPGALAIPAIAIVGARAATPYGLGVARQVARAAAAAGVAVVSGLARGIDAAAHQGALDGGGATVAVQGCGPDRVYPPAHRRLAARIRERGALISELPPGAPPLRHHFPLRNRLISGLARLTLVVEARERSGSLVTAMHALDQGRDVAAVPGPVTAPTSAGANRLLRDGAFVVLEPADALLLLGVVVLPAAEPPAAAPAHPRARQLLDALRAGAATRDELEARIGEPRAAWELALLELELEGWIGTGRDGRLHALPRPT
jgi:DNA processing protein